MGRKHYLDLHWLMPHLVRLVASMMYDICVLAACKVLRVALFFYDDDVKEGGHKAVLT